MNKRYVVLLVGLVLIAVIVVVNALVFTVKEVTVDFDTEANVEVEEGEADAIIEASGIRKGKNIFGVSESKIVNNVQSAIADVKVINVERKFPNKVVIHVSRRIPVYVVAYRQTTSSVAKYVLLDSDMVVLELVDNITEKYTNVEGFELVGRYSIVVGQPLTVQFGDAIYYLQNVAASFYNAGLTPVGFVTFIDDVRFNDKSIELLTNSGVTIILGSSLTTEQVSARVTKAYEWYTSQPEGSQALTKGIAYFDTDSNGFTWNNV